MSSEADILLQQWNDLRSQKLVPIENKILEADPSYIWNLIDENLRWLSYCRYPIAGYINKVRNADGTLKTS